MEAQEMKTCPYCAESIKARAIKCRYCGSNLDKTDYSDKTQDSSVYWRRIRKGKKIAGVCTGLAWQLDVPALILPLRVAFIATTFLGGFGLAAYIILWILMPPFSDEQERKGSSTGAAGPESLSEKDEAGESRGGTE